MTRKHPEIPFPAVPFAYRPNPRFCAIVNTLKKTSSLHMEIGIFRDNNHGENTHVEIDITRETIHIAVLLIP